MKLTVIIKALNEEQKIEACIQSILRETSVYETEIILVDSCSEDNTIEIAKRYPIKIVQFKNKADANCGAAVQLGYQLTKGEFIYLIDGDMEMAEGFLANAFRYMKENKDVAGVSGLIKDLDLTSSVDKRREKIYKKINQPTSVKSLGGGGLYRKAAIESVGYFGHQSLEANEELELGVRLISSGWKLIRLPEIAVSHTGHGLNDYELMLRYAKAGRFKATGKALKAAIGKRWFWHFTSEFKFILIVGAVFLLSLLISLITSLSIGALSWLILSITLWSALAAKKKSVYEATMSIIIWNYCFYNCVLGFFKQLNTPNQLIEYQIVKS